MYDGQQTSLFESCGVAPPADRVAIVAIAKVEAGLLYRLPPAIADLSPGTCIEVPIGRRVVAGYVLSVRDRQVSDRRLKDVLRVIPGAATTAAIVRLVTWGSGYYRVPVGTFLHNVLPSCARAEIEPATCKIVTMVDHIPAVLSRRQTAVVDRLRSVLPPDGMPLGAAAAAIGSTATTLLGLQRAGAITISLRRSSGELRLQATAEHHEPTDEQRLVIERINLVSPAVHLLHGITGSGKTLVYMELIDRVLASGRRALVLLPEIGLTPQLAARFRARFAGAIAIVHSGLADGDRADAYRRILAGEVRVVLGARSALFSPISDLGIIIVDEEHDAAYKQDAQPRYHARDLAIVYARDLGIPVVLGSATPSMESWHNAMNGKYRLHRLTVRPQGGSLPSCVVVDMRSEREEAGAPVLLSQVLIDRVRHTFAAGQQSIVLLNRRGWAPRVFCRACGVAATCPGCDVGMVWHRDTQELVCHHCGSRRPVPIACPSCGSTRIGTAGMGTENLEERLRQLVPGLRLARMDADTTAGRDGHATILARFAAGEVDCLVGTQMVAKGIDFPRVTLVGVVGADLGLNLPDFRSAERTFALISQVSGRAGRGHMPGAVVVQCWDPEAVPIRAAVTNAPASFYQQELAIRREFAYPPFGALVRVEWHGPDQERVAAVAQAQGAALRSAATAHGAVILDPTLCDPAFLHGRFRWSALLKASSRSQAQAVLTTVGDALHHERQVAVVIDVDPHHMT